MHLDRIAKKICAVAEKENQELSSIASEGVFYMPELAFVYECGKAIMKDYSNIFGDSKVKWVREIDLGNGGPTDLVFEIENQKNVAIEFKLRDTSKSYEKDIVKLSRLNDGEYNKLFCALIDVFESKLPDDGRQGYIETLEQYKVLPLYKAYFKTNQNFYTSAVSCVACVWSVGINQ